MQPLEWSRLVAMNSRHGLILPQLPLLLLQPQQLQQQRWAQAFDSSVQLATLLSSWRRSMFGRLRVVVASCDKYANNVGPPIVTT